jgi:hypothetical protein
MKLPNAEQAIVEMSKLVGYCLSSTHFRGRNKARVFQSALGLTVDDAIELQETLKQAARDHHAVEGASDSHGIRYIIDFEMTRNGRTATIRSSWIVPAEDASPRMLTCYVL